MFKQFHISAEKGTRKKSIWADNRGKYREVLLRSSVNKSSIRLEKTVPERTQRTGVAERMNLTICEKIKSFRIRG